MTDFSILPLNSKAIPLTRGAVAVVDSSDFEWLSKKKWNMLTIGYASRSERIENKKKLILMHRLIMNAPQGMEVDHINGNKLDNRRCNLRICTRFENCKNMSNRKNSKCKTSKYKGVYWDKREAKWVAKIMANRKRIGLGYFYCEETAARAYNEGTTKHHGEFARLNVFTEL